MNVLKINSFKHLVLQKYSLFFKSLLKNSKVFEDLC